MAVDESSRYSQQRDFTNRPTVVKAVICDEVPSRVWKLLRTEAVGHCRPRQAHTARQTAASAADAADDDDGT